METVFVFLIRNDVWIYILAVFGLVWYVTQLLRARGALQRAMFGLERERGMQAFNNALFFVVILLFVIGFVFFVNRNIAPRLPAELLKPPTPTPDIFHTPLSSPTPLEAMSAQTTPTPPLVATVTLSGAPVLVEEVTQTPEQPTETAVPPTPFIACNVNLNISQPANGAAVRGDISFFGTVNTENLGFYTLETNGPQTNGQWADLLGRDIDQIVDDSFLGSADLSQWATGPYLVRLTAVDTNNNLTGQCVIQVTLTN